MFQHRQIHVWISESDYRLLRERMTVTSESVSSQIRRLIKTERQRLKCAVYGAGLGAHGTGQMAQGPLHSAPGTQHSTEHLVPGTRHYISAQSECGRLFWTIQP